MLIVTLSGKGEFLCVDVSSITIASADALVNAAPCAITVTIISKLALAAAVFLSMILAHADAITMIMTAVHADAATIITTIANDLQKGLTLSPFY